MLGRHGWQSRRDSQPARIELACTLSVDLVYEDMVSLHSNGIHFSTYLGRISILGHGPNSDAGSPFEGLQGNLSTAHGHGDGELVSRPYAK